MPEKKEKCFEKSVIIRIPDSVCEALGISEGDALEFAVEGEKAFITKAGKYSKPIVKVHNKCTVVNG